MTKALLIALVAIFALSTSAFAARNITGFAPENNLWISADDKAAGVMTEEEFNKVLDAVEVVYTDIIKEKGAEFELQRNWTDGTVNAYAEQQGKKWIVAMFGGLARYSIMTPDGFTYVVCHELGHHLGGAPLYSDDPWAAVEGQSDYYGGLKCVRKVWAKDDNVAIVEGMTIDPTAAAACEKSWSNANDVALCKRSAMAGLTLGSVLNKLGGGYKKVAYSTPSKVVVTKIMESHPPAQCRLDTYLAAATCTVSSDIETSFTDVLVGTCNRATDSIGVRPTCWYKD